MLNMKKNLKKYNFLHSFKKLLNTSENKNMFFEANDQLENPYLKDDEQVETMKHFCSHLEKTKLFNEEEKDFFDESIKALQRKLQYFKIRKTIKVIIINMLIFWSLFFLIYPLESKYFNQIAFDDKIKLSEKQKDNIKNFNYNNIDKRIVELWKLHNQKTQLIYKDFILKNSNFQEYQWDCDERHDSLITLWRDCKVLNDSNELSNIDVELNWLFLKEEDNPKNNSLFIKLSWFLNIVWKYIKYPFLFSNNFSYNFVTGILLFLMFAILSFLVWMVHKLTCVNWLTKYIFFWKLMQSLLHMFKQKIKDNNILNKMEYLLQIEKDINILKKEYSKKTIHYNNTKAEQQFQQQLEKYKKETKEIEQFLEKHNITWDLFEIVKLIVENKNTIDIHEDYIKWKYYSDGFIWNPIILKSFLIAYVFCNLIIFFHPIKNNELNHNIMEHKIKKMIKNEDLKINEENKPYLMFMLNNTEKSFEEKEYLIIKKLEKNINNIKQTSFKEENKMFGYMKAIEDINNKITNIISDIKSDIH